MSSRTIIQEINSLVSSRSTLELATASKDGIPSASYTPFVYGENFNLYVFISTLAIHTHNIAGNNKVSAMIIEDENKSNLFIRERFTLQCQAKMLERESEDFKKWIQLYKKRFGVIVDTLLQLADFCMYELKPERGVYVKGFGQAYRVDGPAMSSVTHIKNPAKDAQESKNQKQE